MGRVLVAGIGNIFCGDDGFGVEVARRLAAERLGDGVEVRDFGIRGVHLAYEMASGSYDEVILVDAAPRGGSPGTVYAIEPEVSAAQETPDAHGLTPAAVLAWVQRVGGTCGHVMVIGCEPASLGPSVGLSPSVAGAVEQAMAMVREHVQQRQV
jgi:hydrogenase maturation protease